MNKTYRGGNALPVPGLGNHTIHRIAVRIQNAAANFLCSVLNDAHSAGLPVDTPQSTTPLTGVQPDKQLVGRDKQRGNTGSRRLRDVHRMLAAASDLDQAA